MAASDRANSISPILFEGETSVISSVTQTPGINDPGLEGLGMRMLYKGKEYVYVYNAGGASASVGYGMVLNSAATNYSVTVTCTAQRDTTVGIVYHSTMLTACYGWLVTKGIVPVQMGVSAAVALHPLETGTDGVFMPVSNTTANYAPSIGQAMAVIASSVSGNAFVRL
jgi:hypothetical protein